MDSSKKTGLATVRFFWKQEEGNGYLALCNKGGLGFLVTIVAILQKSFSRKVHQQTAFVLWAGGIDVGVLRYNLFWDQTPFLNLIYLAEEYRSVGLGRQALASWKRK